MVLPYYIKPESFHPITFLATVQQNSDSFGPDNKMKMSFALLEWPRITGHYLMPIRQQAILPYTLYCILDLAIVGQKVVYEWLLFGHISNTYWKI